MGGKALLHIVNDSDVFLKDLMRLKGDVKTIGRNIKLAPGPRVKVVWTVEKRERASDLASSAFVGGSIPRELAASRIAHPANAERVHSMRE